jgi:hypothetical protein
MSANTHLYNPNNFKYVTRPRFPGVGARVAVAGWLLLIALLNLFYAISVIAGSDIFITTASWLVGDARPWGGLMLIVALIQLATVPAVLLGRMWGMWITLLSVAWHIAAAIMFLSDEAAIAIVLLLIDIGVLGALAMAYEDA